MEKYSFHGNQKSRDQLLRKLWRLLLNFVFWAIVHICLENSLTNLIDSILVVWSSTFWQLWNFFLKILVSMETWILLFTYFGIKECRPFQRYMKRNKKTFGVVKCIWEFRLPWLPDLLSWKRKSRLTDFLQISPNLEIFAHLKMFLIYYHVF